MCITACTKQWSAQDFSESLRKGDVATVRTALDQGFPANTSYDEQFTPLHMILDVSLSPNLPDSTRVQIISLLLEHGADPNKKNKMQFSPLHFAAVYGPEGAADKLVAAGANLNAKTSSGTTPLAYAVLASRLEVVRLLLDHGADPNVNQMTALDNKGMTPLHLAARGQPTVDTAGTESYRPTPGQAEIIKSLLDKGADPSIRDGNGRTPLEIAELNSQEQAIKALKATK